VKRDERTGSPAPGLQATANEVHTRVELALKRLGFDPSKPEFFQRIARLAALLAHWGGRMNLTAQPDNPAEIAYHVVDSLMPLVLARSEEGTILGQAFTAQQRILDVGSGAGFPGLILAAASDGLFTLCESRRKRASFLSVATAEMGLLNVTVAPIHARPESFHSDFDTVVARAVGDLPKLFGLAGAALRSGGLLLLYAAPTQPLRQEAKLPLAAGLVPYAEFAYQIDRDRQSVPRLLAIWRKE
jgi:16S rRNA (guanine527-N7)-methyltransferase